MSGRITDFTGKNLYIEWVTISEREKIIQRRIQGLWDVFARVGGIINCFKMFAALFLTWFAEINFKIEAINTLLKIKTEDKEPIRNDLVSKLSLLTPKCANKKLKRMV